MRQTRIVDTFNDYKITSGQGWANCTVTTEDSNGEPVKLAIPPKNAQIGLKIGDEIVIRDHGKFGQWLVLDESPCFGGGGIQQRGGDYRPRNNTNYQPSGGFNNRQQNTTHRGSFNNPQTNNNTQANRAPAQNYSSNNNSKYEQWSDYQINVRDPQIKSQEMLKITKDIYIFCYENQLNYVDVINEIIAYSKELGSQV